LTALASVGLLALLSEQDIFAPVNEGFQVGWSSFVLLTVCNSGIDEVIRRTNEEKGVSGDESYVYLLLNTPNMSSPTVVRITRN
jgi:hypothetical protein